MIDGPLEILVRQLASLPGLGGRSARRIALHLLGAKETRLSPLIRALEDASDSIVACTVCGNLDSSDPCRVCANPSRDRDIVCIVSGVADLWALERTGSFKGVYHILGGVLSALDGIGPEQLTIEPFLLRLQGGTYREVVLALSATVGGQSTAHYIMDRINGAAVQNSALASLRITRLAHGVPVGGALEFLDDSTIATAMKSRASF